MVLVIGWSVLLLLTPFLRYHNIAILVTSWALISLAVTLVTGMAAWRQGFRIARFFLIAWFGALAGLILVMLVRQSSVEEFIAFATNEEYLAGIGHRTAAVWDSRILPLSDWQVESTADSP